MSGINATWNRATTRDRALVFVGAAALVAVAGAAMFASLDGVALQLALRDPVKVWVEHLPALALGSLTVGAVAALFAASGRLGALLHWSSVASIFVLWQVGGSMILAPLFANELEPEHAGMVFPVVAGIGAYPLAAAVGTWLGTRIRSRRSAGDGSHGSASTEG